MVSADVGLAIAACGGELGQIVHGELVQSSAGLDQQAGRHLQAGGDPDPFGETQLGGQMDTGSGIGMGVTE